MKRSCGYCVLGFWLVLALVATGCESGTVTTVSEPTGSTQTTHVELETSLATSTTKTDVSSKEDPVPLGQEVQVGDWRVTMAQAVGDAAALLAGPNFREPMQGYEYLAFRVQATYMGDRSGLSFEEGMAYGLRGGDGKMYHPPGIPVANSISEEPAVSHGDTVTGNMVWEVASDQLSGSILLFADISSSNSGYVYFAVE